MKAKQILKKSAIIIAISLIAVMLNTGKSSAALQANQNTQYTKTDTLESWQKNIRNMEATGGAMGLSETINSDLTSSSGSNNIDVHAMKTTEYGAIAILSASSYGNPSNDQAITTTTGNNTGVILKTSAWEYTSGGIGTQSKYFDAYGSQKVGDALNVCNYWHKASNCSWIVDAGFYFVRGKGGIFSFNHDNYNNYNYRHNGTYLNYARGVAVCGTGL